MNNYLQPKQKESKHKSNTSIIEKCAQYLLKSYISKHKKINKTNKDKVYNDTMKHIKNSFIDNFIHALVTEKNFKHLIDMGGSNIDYYIVNYFKKQGHLIETDCEYQLSTELATECFCIIENHYELFINMSDFLNNNYLYYTLFNSEHSKDSDEIANTIKLTKEHYENAYNLIQVAKEKYFKNK